MMHPRVPLPRCDHREKSVCDTKRLLSLTGSQWQAACDSGSSHKHTLHWQSVKVLSSATTEKAAEASIGRLGTFCANVR